MATKLYVTNLTPGYTPPTLRGAWDDSASAVARALDTLKEFGGPIALLQFTETAGAAGHDILLYRGITGPLAAQTVDGTIDVVLAVAELASDADFAWHLHVYVTQGNTDTPRGTLLTDYLDANEWPTTAQGFALAAAQAIGPLVVSDGDRIVVEIGLVAQNAIAAGKTGRFWYGVSQGTEVPDVLPDLTAGSTAVTTEAGSITFSDDLVWSALTIGRLTQDMGEVSEDSTADATVPHLTQVIGEITEDDGAFPSIGWLTQVMGEVLVDNGGPPPPTPIGMGVVGGKPRRARKVYAPVASMGWLPFIPTSGLVPTPALRPPSRLIRRPYVLEATVLPILIVPGVYGKAPGWQYPHFGDTFNFSDERGSAWEFSADNVGYFDNKDLTQGA